MDPNKQEKSKENSAPSKQLEDNENETDIADSAVIVREETYIHVEYKSSETNINVHSAIKSFMIQLRKADP